MFQKVDIAQRVFLSLTTIVFLYYLFFAPKIDIKRKNKYEQAVRIIGLWGCGLAWFFQKNFFFSAWYVAYYLLSLIGVMWPFIPNARSKQD